MAFSSEQYRWGYDHYADSATFLADTDTIVENFPLDAGDKPWTVACDNLPKHGERQIGLNARTTLIGNDILSPFTFAALTTNQYNWLLTNRFNGGDVDAPATIGIYDQKTGAWSVYTCIVTQPPEEAMKPINNNYLSPVIFTFSAASELA
jgi:hypothetical protein